MPKPDWLVDAEKKREASIIEPPMCRDCISYGVNPVKNIRYRGKQKTMMYECAIHQGCMCTEFSIGCEDHSKRI